MPEPIPDEQLKAYVQIFKQLPRPTANELLLAMGGDDEFAPSSRIMQAALLTVAGNRLFGETVPVPTDTHVLLDLIRDLADPDPCWYDHHGGCQAHGYLSLERGERCPHAVAKELIDAQASVSEEQIGSGND